MNKPTENGWVGELLRTCEGSQPSWSSRSWRSSSFSSIEEAEVIGQTAVSHIHSRPIGCLGCLWRQLATPSQRSPLHLLFNSTSSWLASMPRPFKSNSSSTETSVINSAQKIPGCSLPTLEELYSSRCLKREQHVVKDIHRPGRSLFELLPSGRRYRNIRTAPTPLLR